MRAGSGREGQEESGDGRGWREGLHQQQEAREDAALDFSKITNFFF